MKTFTPTQEQVEQAISEVVTERFSAGARCITIDQVRANLYRKHGANPDPVLLATFVAYSNKLERNTNSNSFYFS